MDTENTERPVAVIECKAPQVSLDMKAREQIQDMLSDIYEEMDIGEPPERIAFDELQRYLEDDFSSREDGDYGLFELIEDYGIRLLTYGNAGGGSFFGPYRSFLVRMNDNVIFFHRCDDVLQNGKIQSGENMHCSSS